MRRSVKPGDQSAQADRATRDRTLLREALQGGEQLPEGYRRAGQMLHTPFGPLHQPCSDVRQVLCAIVAFFACPTMGWLCSLPVGGLTENTRFLYSIPPALVFFFGYGLWITRLKAIGFDLIGRGLLRALWLLIRKRGKPENLKDLLPTHDSLARAAVKAQQAASSFMIVAFPICLLAGLVGLLVGTGALVVRILAYPLATLACGYTLSWLGRHGYLPLPDTDAV